MICISIAQESRRFALVDMLNAARQCDLLELRLDCFQKAPEFKELIDAKPKPVIMSCRRPQDGGEWQGNETDRLALLRQCIISKADYVEIELDVADQIRKFPPTKRVISYTNLQGTPANIGEIYEECQSKNPDIIKLVTLARTPEEAWPLVPILAKPALPTVVVGLGKPGLMLTVLGKKIGAPWTYAALERGMESYPGQPTVGDLNNVYHYQAIERSTRLVGVTGFSELSYVTVALLNAALAHLELPARCLPLGVGNMKLFRKVIDATHLASVVVDDEHRGAILEVATEQEPAVQQAHAADLIVHKEDKWHGYNTLSRAAVAALETTLLAKAQSDKPLNGRMVMIAGSNAMARMMAYVVKRRQGNPIIASRDRDAGLKMAQTFGCRQVNFESLYSTMHDILIVCGEDAEPQPAKGKTTPDPFVKSSYLRPGMTVMDLSAMPRRSPMLIDAKQRGCNVVSPREVLLNQLELQIRLISSKEVPRGKLLEVLNSMIEEEEE